MGNFKSQRELIKAITANIDQLETGELSLSQLENHMNDVRELYERTVVLRYKIFEEKSDITTENKSQETPIVTIPTIQEVEEPTQPMHTPDEPPVIDFNLFDEEEEEEETIIDEVEEKVIEPEIIEAIQPIVEETKIEEAIIPSQSTHSDFNRKFSDIISQTAGQFGFSKLDTLVGAFGLNERLQYINELFDGSSDVFSEAIKSLDSMPSLDSAKGKTAQLAEQNKWDLESDTVEEFIQKLCRRYA